MAFVDLQQDPGTSFRSFRRVRRVLVTLAVLYFLTLLSHQSLLPVLILLIVGLLGCFALVLAPALVIENRDWKSIGYAVVLLAAFPVWHFSMLWIVRTSNDISNERAKTFIAKVKDHVTVTGILPTSEEELDVAGLSLPRTILGSRMTYRVHDPSRPMWPPFPAGKEPSATNRKHLPFSVTFDAGIWVRCEHFSHTDQVQCED
jgi:hypothetical protein